MSKPEWGIKRLCPSCGARFYDLKKTPITCPKCATQIDPEMMTKVRRPSANDRKGRSAHTDTAGQAMLPNENLSEEDLVDDDVLIEDADDLDQDASDVIEEIDTMEPIDHEEE